MCAVLAEEAAKTEEEEEITIVIDETKKADTLETPAVEVTTPSSVLLQVPEKVPDTESSGEKIFTYAFKVFVHHSGKKTQHKNIQ